MPSVPREPDDNTPRLDDYLTEEQQVRLARVLVGVYLSAAENRAAAERAAAPQPAVETAPAVELTPAQKARARAKHARRIAFEQPEAES